MSAPQLVTIERPILTPEQEQEKWLGEALRNVKEKSANMKRAMAQNSFVQVLRCASQMLSELRTGMLSPQHYYELYSQVFDELQAVEYFFEEEAGRGRSLEDMYEVVQHAGNIVPRLYLLITVGSVYVKSKQAPARDLLKDLVEMCKGVQHPTRGLFLRHYLLTKAKNLLPDTGNEYEGEGGSVEDSASFVLQNFKEMVWLWVRMENRTEQQARARREKERKELRILVGFNIVRLSQMDGIDKHAYQQAILPRIINIILSYKEPLAQEYLLGVIVQVFPDEFHLYALQDLLSALSSAHIVPGVNIHSILTLLMDRLGNYVAGLRDGTVEGSSKKEGKIIKNMFDVFRDQIAAMGSSPNAANFSLSSYAETQFSLLKLVLKTYPDAYDRVDEVLGSLKERLSQSEVDLEAVKVVKRLVQYLSAELKDANILLELQHFDSLIETLPFNTRREIAISLCGSIVDSGVPLVTLERVAKLFEVIAPIVKDVQDTPNNKTDIYKIDPVEEFLEEQSLVCRTIHLMDSPDPAVLFKMYGGVRKQLGQGGPERTPHTLKAVASLYIRLALRVRKLEVEGGETNGITSSKPLQYLHNGDGKGILEVLAVDQPLSTFQLYLSAAATSDVCELEDVTYELYAAAFTIYEENAADTKDQLSLLSQMVSSLHALQNLSDENYGVIAGKVCQYSSKLLKRQDQSRMAAQCAQLFWRKSSGDAQRVVECLQRSLKLAGQTQSQHQLALYVELLNQFLHYYAADVPTVTVKLVSALLDLIRDCSSNQSDDAGDQKAHNEARLFYRNTTKYIRSRQKEEEKWLEIEV